MVVRVAEMGGRGRGMVCIQPVKAGQIVLRDSPILLYPSPPLHHPSSHPLYCSHCFRKLDLINGSSSQSSCSSCSLAFFCSLRCRQSSSSSSHTLWLCKTLIRLSEFPPFLHLDLDRQSQLRFLLSAYNLAATSPPDFRILQSLHGSSDGDDVHAQILHPMISIFSNPPCDLSICSPRTTADLLVKDKLNAFSIMAPFSQESGRSVRAYGIYPNASFFNHDCLPNVCRFDYVDGVVGDGNADVIIRAIHDVPEGREACLSYFPVNARYSERQKWLMEDYGFECGCDRCKVESAWTDEEEDDEQMEEMMDDMEEGEENESMAVEADVDFPHAYFFVRFMCDKNNCWGTLSPLPPCDAAAAAPSEVMECNVCGSLKKIPYDRTHGTKLLAAVCYMGRSLSDVGNISSGKT